MDEKECIGRDTVVELFNKWADGYSYIEVPTKDAIACVRAIPAADVRPVVRGRWVGNKRHQSCSECHMTYCVPDGQDGELDMTAYHFCPNCGADMRGGRKANG